MEFLVLVLGYHSELEGEVLGVDHLHRRFRVDADRQLAVLLQDQALERGLAAVEGLVVLLCIGVEIVHRELEEDLGVVGEPRVYNGQQDVLVPSGDLAAELDRIEYPALPVDVREHAEDLDMVARYVPGIGHCYVGAYGLVADLQAVDVAHGSLVRLVEVEALIDRAEVGTVAPPRRGRVRVAAAAPVAAPVATGERDDEQDAQRVFGE